MVGLVMTVLTPTNSKTGYTYNAQYSSTSAIYNAQSRVFLKLEISLISIQVPLRQN